MHEVGSIVKKVLKCISGHGLCGLSKLSIRSIVATAIFFPSAVVFANLFRLVGVN